LSAANSEHLAEAVVRPPLAGSDGPAPWPRVLTVVQVTAASIWPKVAFSKDAFPNCRSIQSNRPSQTPARFRQDRRSWKSKRN